MPLTPQIYLDNNATTRVDPAVVEAITECWQRLQGNPASQHQAGRDARRILEQAREHIAQMLGANTSDTHADHLIFTSGGTESNNLALRGLAGSPPGRIVISSLEHPSISSLADRLSTEGFSVTRLPTKGSGIVDIAALADVVQKDACLVSVMLASNETGVLQPIPEVALLCRRAGVLLHTDGVQAVGKIPVSFRQLQVDALSLSAHKFHGPVGIGGLLLRHHVKLQPAVYGGFQQQGLRPGTESVALAVGMCKALELWQQESSHRVDHMRQMRSMFESRLRSGCPQLVVHGTDSPRLPNTISLALPGIDRQALVMALDLAGVACSTGAACASGSSEPSPVLLAMNIDPELVERSIRLSLSAHTTAREVVQAADCILELYNDLQRPIGARKTPGSPRNS